MKILLITLTFILTIFSTVWAQDYQEVVYLKNGSIIRGTIIEQVPNKSIKIETSDGSIFVYQMDEVEKITKESPQGSSSKHRKSNLSGKYAGYLNVGIVSMSTSIDGYDGISVGTDVFNIAISNGFYISDMSSLGIGISYEDWNGTGLLPIYLDSKTFFDIAGSSFQPIITGRLGYSLYPDGDFSGEGLYIYFGGGVRYLFSEKTGLMIDIGYRRQEHSGGSSGGFAFNVGLSF